MLAPGAVIGDSFVVALAGEIVQETSHSDDTPRDLLDVSRIRAFSRDPRLGLREGIASTYRWFVERHAEARL